MASPIEHLGYNRADVNSEYIAILVYKRYRFHVTEIRTLPGYYDLNFHIKVAKNDQTQRGDIGKLETDGYLVKILNSADSAKTDVIEKQHAMISYVRQNGIPTPVPVSNVDGKLFSLETLPVARGTGATRSETAAKFMFRLFEYVPGKTFMAVGCPSEVLETIGKLIGKLHRCLRNYKHDFLSYETIWRIQQFPKLYPLCEQYCDAEELAIAKSLLHEYYERVLPALPNLQPGLIHGDINQDNILLRPQVDGTTTNTIFTIAALIDFGDSSEGYYVFDIAIAVAHMFAVSGGQLETCKPILAGYLSENSLNQVEKSILKLCVCIRLLQLVVLGSHAQIDNPDVKTETELYREPLKLSWAMTDTEWCRRLHLL